MRSPPNAFYTLYTPYSAGPPAPFATFPCRVVIWDEIQPAAPPPLFNIIGYITVDPPYLHTAGATLLLGGHAFEYDLNSSTPVGISTRPGVLYFILLIDEITTARDTYSRYWLCEVANLP